MAQTVKGLPTMRETQVQSLGQANLLEKEMATHSSILARDGSPVKVSDEAMRAIRFRAIGDESGETTGIENSELKIENSDVIYDLQGRRVEKMEKGVYIVNGKKVVW